MICKIKTCGGTKTVMLSEKITALYELLQCNNTDIANHAGCSASNISHIKTGNREPKPTSRPIQTFVGGVYSYADYENLLTVLQDLCQAEDTSRECLIPALIGWLYNTDAVPQSVSTVTPRSKQVLKLHRRTFGERLDAAMSTLGLTNSRLAFILSIDSSLISRYRSGVYSPHGNKKLSQQLIHILSSQTELLGKTKEMRELCGADPLNETELSHWLYGLPEDDPSAIANMLLSSLEGFALGDSLPAEMPDIPEVEIRDHYLGTDGLRKAVIRFLTNAADSGGELFLYSDEPMDWMSGDREYYNLWKYLMVRCVKKGVHIKIIHNLNRDFKEMIQALTGWLPLYISGTIEPYVFRKESSARFNHTVFLRKQGDCIIGAFPSGTGENRWYDYITDRNRLAILDEEYRVMLTSSAPFLKTYTTHKADSFRTFRLEQIETNDYLVRMPPLFTMPEKLLKSIINRAGIDEEKTKHIVSYYRKQRRVFKNLMKQSHIRILLCPDNKEGYLNFSLDLFDVYIAYTEDEYTEHLAEIAKLVKNERNFHLALLPQEPFRDIQLMTMQDAVTAIRCREPYAAFVFQNDTLTKSVYDYLDILFKQHTKDRSDTIEQLKEISICTTFFQ